jgi:hypothetical protein
VRGWRELFFWVEFLSDRLDAALHGVRRQRPATRLVADDCPRVCQQQLVAVQRARRHPIRLLRKTAVFEATDIPDAFASREHAAFATADVARAPAQITIKSAVARCTIALDSNTSSSWLMRTRCRGS